MSSKFKSEIVEVPRFTPKPIASTPVPHCPALAPNGTSNMHCDGYMSDTYTWSGPNGGKLLLTKAELPGLSPTLVFTAAGNIVTVCTSVKVHPDKTMDVTRSLLMLDPTSMATIASLELPSGSGGSTGFGGGGYIYLNNLQQVVTPTANQQLWIIGAIDSPPGFVPVQQIDLAPSIDDATASVQSAMPDWSGRIWWVTDTGIVAYTDAGTGESYVLKLPEPQQIGNSFAVDETGGVFIASNYAMYRFDVARTGDLPTVTWRYSYDRGVRQKPGQQNFGTGTTPTLVGKNYCGITDNADPQMHVVVYRRDQDFEGNRIVCEVPVFKPEFSDTENSLIGYDGHFLVENNFGYTGTYLTPTGPVTPGFAKVAFDGSPVPGSVVWQNDAIVIPSVVTKLSLGNGLAYTYTLEIMHGIEHWFITAVDVATGTVVYSVPTGLAVENDNHYASLFISPTGIIYVPVWTGLISLTQLPG